MDSRILYSKAFAMVEIKLQKQESVVAEKGSMSAMRGNARIKTSIGGTHKGILGYIISLFAAILRRLFGGESIFMNTYTAMDDNGLVLYASPASIGDITEQELIDQELTFRKGAFLAATPGVRIKTVWGGIRTLLGGAGLTLLKATGTGVLWLNAEGGIEEIMVMDSYTVDTGHVLSFGDGLKLTNRTAGGVKTTLFGSELMVARFSGQGKLLIQSHTEENLIQRVIEYLPDV